jgi:methyl-accepting chemotaxis protein
MRWLQNLKLRSKLLAAMLFIWLVQLGVTMALLQPHGMVATALLILLASALVMVLVALGLGQALTSPIEKATGVIDQIAEERDLTLQVPVSTRDETGMMAEAFNMLVISLRVALAELRVAAARVAAGSFDVGKHAEANRVRTTEDSEIAAIVSETIMAIGETAAEVAGKVKEMAGTSQSALDELAGLVSSLAKLAELAGAQSRQVDQVTAAVQEIGESHGQLAQIFDSQVVVVTDALTTVNRMTGTVEQLDQAVAQAQALTGKALAAAEQGVEKVNDTIDEVRASLESSDRTDEIISVIAAVAEQADLVALNASIEAARGGQPGGGHIAEEIGRLARQSTEAAQEVTRLITDSGDHRLAAGSRVTEELTAALTRAAEQTRSSQQANQEILEATGELRQGAAGLLAAVEELSRLIQQVNRMAAEQPERRAQIDEALSRVVEQLDQLTATTQESDRIARQVVEGTEGLVSVAAEVESMTDLQLDRCIEVRHAARRGSETAEGAQLVVGASEELRSYSSRLAELVNRFNTGTPEPGQGS